MAWSTRVASFAVVVRSDAWLVIRQQRLGVSRWELPGGHLEAGEDGETAAARETLEETGVEVSVGPLIATCLHEWEDIQQRKLILFYLCTPRAGALAPRTAEPGIECATWRTPSELDRADTSAFLHPLLDAWPAPTRPDFPPLMYRAQHRLGDDGRWHPTLIPYTAQ
jgi:ADP-ribose pyrophosphatase YjhB (NUDIX family)